MADIDTASYAHEIKFSVGQRVLVSIPEVKPEATNCKEGIIIGIQTRFARSPNLRQHSYKVRFDEGVIKEEHIFLQQIYELYVAAEQLTLRELILPKGTRREQ